MDVPPFTDSEATVPTALPHHYRAKFHLVSSRLLSIVDKAQPDPPLQMPVRMPTLAPSF